MRFAVLLLFTTTLSAQWVSPIEQRYGPYVAPFGGGEPALVASNGGILLAWSERDPQTQRAEIRTGILDFDGRLVSEIRRIPNWQAGVDATSPVVATDGSSFALAWMEIDRHTRIAAVPLSADGIRVTEPRVFDEDFHGATPTLVWTGAAYFVAGDAFDRLGNVVLPPPVIPKDLRYASGDVLVAMRWGTLPRREICWWRGCGWLDPEFNVEWELVQGRHRETGLRQYRYHSETRTVTAGDADEMAIVWRSPTALAGIRVVDGEYESRFKVVEDPEAPQPDGIAFDGDRWLLVFTRDNDVWGAFIDRTSKDLIPFPIATGERVESTARVIAISPGRFLVSYSSDVIPGDHRFAGRIVLAEAPLTKRRALR